MFLIIGLVRPIFLVHKAHKHVLQQVLGLRYQSKHCVYFCLCIPKMCANFQEATPHVCTLFSSSLGWYDPSHWYTRRTNTYCSKFLRYDIKLNTVYTLFMYSKDVCKFSRGHSTCLYFIFLIIGLIRPIPLVHKAHKHVLQQVFGL